jgi:hypothetical protein
MWYYHARPVRATNPDIQETWNNGAHFAFDGYGGSTHPHSIAHRWFQPGHPSAQKPFFCTLDYGEPVAISKFVHYFYEPTVKDYRADPSSTSSASFSLNIHRSDDGVSWPLAESLTVSADWISAQQCTICLRWLVQEVNLRSAGKIDVDPVTLTGTILGSPGKLAFRPDEVTVKAQHGQVNWLGFRTDKSCVLAILNHDAATPAQVEFRSLPSAPPTMLSTSDGKHWREETERPESRREIGLPTRGTVLIVWQAKSV